MFYRQINSYSSKSYHVQFLCTQRAEKPKSTLYLYGYLNYDNQLYQGCKIEKISHIVPTTVSWVSHYFSVVRLLMPGFCTLSIIGLYNITKI